MEGHLLSHDPLFEVASEGLGLVTLNLTVLYRSTPQELIQMDCIDCGGSLFVLSGPRADPVVDVVARGAAHLLRLEKKNTDTHIEWKNSRQPIRRNGKAPRTTMIQCSSSCTYRQKYVAVTLVKVSVPLLGHEYQIHFLLRRTCLLDFHFFPL